MVVFIANPLSVGAVKPPKKTPHVSREMLRDAVIMKLRYDLLARDRYSWRPQFQENDRFFLWQAVDMSSGTLNNMFFLVDVW